MSSNSVLWRLRTLSDGGGDGGKPEQRKPPERSQPEVLQPTPAAVAVGTIASGIGRWWSQLGSGEALPAANVGRARGRSRSDGDTVLGKPGPRVRSQTMPEIAGHLLPPSDADRKQLDELKAHIRAIATESKDRAECHRREVASLKEVIVAMSGEVRNLSSERGMLKAEIRRLALQLSEPVPAGADDAS